MSFLKDLSAALTPKYREVLRRQNSQMGFTETTLEYIDPVLLEKYLKIFHIIDQFETSDTYQDPDGLPYSEFAISPDQTRLTCALQTYRRVIPMVIDLNPTEETVRMARANERVSSLLQGNVIRVPDSPAYLGAISEEDNQSSFFTFTVLL